MSVAIAKPELTIDRLLRLVQESFDVAEDNAMDAVLDLLQERMDDPWRKISRWRVTSFFTKETKRSTAYVVEYLIPDIRPGESKPHWVPRREERKSCPSPALFEALEACTELYLTACQFNNSERENLVLTKAKFSRCDDEDETLGIQLAGIKHLVGEGEAVAGEKLAMSLSPVRYVAPPGGGDDRSKVMDIQSITRIERLHREILRYLMGETAQLSLSLEG